MLQVIAPYDSEDARGLLKASIRDPDPVVFLENEILYGTEFPVDEKVLDKDFTVPIGKCKASSLRSMLCCCLTCKNQATGDLTCMQCCARYGELMGRSYHGQTDTCSSRLGMKTLQLTIAPPVVSQSGTIDSSVSTSHSTQHCLSAGTTWQTSHARSSACKPPCLPPKT